MFDVRLCEELSDEELVVRSLKEREFFGCVVDRYEAKLLRYILRITGATLEEAQDLLQESFIKAYMNLNGFDPDLKFSSWMYRIVYHHVVSAHRKRKIRPEGNTLDIDDDIFSRIASEENILGNIESEERKAYLSRALQRLDEKYREVLLLYYFEEKDYREISDILQKPMGSVATLLSRAKKRLSSLLIREQNI